MGTGGWCMFVTGLQWPARSRDERVVSVAWLFAVSFCTCLPCVINSQMFFFFFSFSLFVEIIEPTTSSPVSSPGQYPHTFTKYVWVLLRDSYGCIAISITGIDYEQLCCGGAGLSPSVFVHPLVCLSLQAPYLVLFSSFPFQKPSPHIPVFLHPASAPGWCTQGNAAARCHCCVCSLWKPDPALVLLWTWTLVWGLRTSCCLIKWLVGPSKTSPSGGSHFRVPEGVPGELESLPLAWRVVRGPGIGADFPFS